MRNVFIIIFFTTCLFNLKGQRPSGRFRIDACLRQINVIALKDYQVFLLQLEKDYHIPASMVDHYHSEKGILMADIYMVLELSRFSNHPMNDVIMIYQSNSHYSWSRIGKELGIYPGSVEFQVIRENIRMKTGKLKVKGKKH